MNSATPLEHARAVFIALTELGDGVPRSIGLLFCFSGKLCRFLGATEVSNHRFNMSRRSMSGDHEQRVFGLPDKPLE